MLARRRANKTGDTLHGHFIGGRVIAGALHLRSSVNLYEHLLNILILLVNYDGAPRGPQGPQLKQQHYRSSDFSGVRVSQRYLVAHPQAACRDSAPTAPEPEFSPACMRYGRSA